ncbi:DUF3857 domain-containing protein [Qipengyuania spongiae]|uniref:DUF3857 domain-containing protein n=1 Tax=Qipengyuania spongiae TaxID=2909673 RepID=A0ABY5SUY2_9SPHN|nr:DUF3857 domain-containing protein [Qipengyuania spongiae]UVI38363.1 DUF3857 domain-containing protein [Qipengyuania spongiae]
MPAWVEMSEALAVPDDPQGLVFVRRNDTLVRLRDQGQDTYVAQHLKILNPQALQLGNVGLVWNPAVGAPTVHTLRIHRDRETIDLLESAEFEVLRREGQLEQAMLDGNLTAIYRVPDLRVGDELEFAYSGPTQDPTLGATSFGLMVLADAPQPGRFRLGLNWVDGQKPNVKLTPDFEKVAVISPNAIRIDLDNPGILSAPKDAPPRYSWTRIAEYSDFNDWQGVSRRFGSLYADAAELGPQSALAVEADRIRDAHSSELQRAAAALRLVQAQVRYIYVGLDGGNFTPASAEETWQRRYGDCKGKTVLLLALLDQLGIDAQPVLVSNSGFDDGLDERLPSPGLFDHVLVQAKIGGETFWMDGTLPEVAPPATDPLVPYRFILPLTRAGASLVHLAEKPFALAQEMGLYAIDASAGFDEPAKLTTTIVTRGMQGLVEYVRTSAMTPGQLTESYRSALAGSDQWDTITDVTYHYDSATRASIVKITGTGPLDWSGDSPGMRTLVLPGGGFSPPGRKHRSADQDSSIPFYTEPSFTCHATTLKFPEGTALENWGFNTAFDKMMYGRLYYRMMERREDRTLRLVRGSRTESSEISTKEAVRDNGRLADFDNSRAVATYDPDTVMKPHGDLHPVPAIDEIDWTGPDAPCLPSDVLQSAGL